MEAWGAALTGLVIAVGLVGVVLPLLPGLLLVWGAVAVWSVAKGGAAAYVLLIAVSGVAVGSQVVKYVVPGRQLQRAGVPNRTLVLGGVLAVVGFFVLPVIGIIIGFVAGVYLAERQRLGGHVAARTSTGHALRAVGMSILVELVAGMLIAAGWVGVLVAT